MYVSSCQLKLHRGDYNSTSLVLEQDLVPIDDQEHDLCGATPDPHVLSKIDVSQLIDWYFSNVNHAFPVLSKASFKQWSDDGVDADPAYRTCLKSLICSALLQSQFSGTNPSSAYRQAYLKCLGDAVSDYGKLFGSSPSLHTVQAMTSLLACSQTSENGLEISVPILATAIRYAYMLNLHHLDEQEGLTIAERMERIRLFWCLYILDRSMNLRLHLPPSIDDKDLYVVSPRMWSDDGVGLVRMGDLRVVKAFTTARRLSSVQCSFRTDFTHSQIRALDRSAELSLFAARQRLAVISGDIWSSLYTFSGERQPVSYRRLEGKRLQCRLLDWKREWFAVDHANVEWSSECLVSIVFLQFEYFYCLLKSDPETFPPKEPKSVSMMANDSSYIFNLQAEAQSGAAPWIDAARETLQLAGVVRKGGRLYLK